jgi:hypothetical protein
MLTILCMAHIKGSMGVNASNCIEAEIGTRRLQKVTRLNKMR